MLRFRIYTILWPIYAPTLRILRMIHQLVKIRVLLRRSPMRPATKKGPTTKLIIVRIVIVWVHANGLLVAQSQNARIHHVRITHIMIKPDTL